MLRKVFLLILFFLAATPALRAGETVQIPGGPDAYLAIPSGAEPSTKRPAVILIHEWWGLNDQIRGIADQLAQQGYTALAVDLYRQKSTQDPAEAHELMRGLPDDRAEKDLEAATTYLKNRPDTGKIAVMGWCMGGGYALKHALEDPRLSAVIMYYGKLVTEEETLKKLNMPLLGFFGGEDRGIPADSVEAFKMRLEKLGKPVEITIYPGAGHAFANPENKTGYNPEAAKDSWAKTLVFLKGHLIS